jgi:hypothetical protein
MILIPACLFIAPLPSNPAPPAVAAVVRASVSAGHSCCDEHGQECGWVEETAVLDEPSGVVSGGLGASSNTQECCGVGACCGTGYASANWTFNSEGGSFSMSAPENCSFGKGGTGEMAIQSYRRVYLYPLRGSGGFQGLYGRGEIGLSWCCGQEEAYQVVSLGADVDEDGIVNAQDVARVLQAWGKLEADDLADVNLDGVVGPLDLAAVLGAWGTKGGTW